MVTADDICHVVMPPVKLLLVFKLATIPILGRKGFGRLVRCRQIIANELIWTWRSCDSPFERLSELTNHVRIQSHHIAVGIR
jgi:hypothetical protein